MNEIDEQTFERVGELVEAVRLMDEAADLARRTCAHALAVLAELKKEGAA